MEYQWYQPFDDFYALAKRHSIVIAFLLYVSYIFLPLFALRISSWWINAIIAFALCFIPFANTYGIAVLLVASSHLFPSDYPGWIAALYAVDVLWILFSMFVTANDDNDNAKYRSYILCIYCAVHLFIVSLIR